VSRYVHSASNALKILGGNVPPCVLHAVLSSWTNSWTTERRFQQDMRDCVLCSSCKGKYEMEHYLVCPFGFQAISRKLRLSPSQNHAARFMLVDPRRSDDTVLMALALYGVRGTVHKLRAQQYRAVPGESQKHIWEQIRIAAAHHAGVGRRLKFLWADVA
jgi:hypothetical protein